MRHVGVALAVLLLSGCSTYSWYNPNVPPEIAQRDQQDCRNQARQIATIEMMDDDPFWSGAGWRHHRRPVAPMTSGLAIEGDLFDRCMRYKGYALVKDPSTPLPAGR